jgi:hypothetical protein
MWEEGPRKPQLPRRRRRMMMTEEGRRDSASRMFEGERLKRLPFQEEWRMSKRGKGFRSVRHFDWDFGSSFLMPL